MAKLRYGEVAMTTLRIVGLAGVVAVGITCPNLLQLIPREERHRYTRRAVDQALRRLKRRGLVQFDPLRGQLSLTERGYGFLHRCELKQASTKHGKWDKKWRLLIFDIQEKRRSARKRLRDSLKRFGFVRLQNSVWIYPYECKELLELVRIDCGVRWDALYLKAEHLDRDQWLRGRFQIGISRKSRKNG